MKNLLEKIDGFTNYDYIILDTNPSLNTLLKCALCSANWAILPCKPTRYAVQGMATLSSTLVGAQQEYNPELKVAGILPVDFDGRANVYRDTLGNLEDVAKKMGMGEDFISGMFGRLEDYGFHNNIINDTEDGLSLIHI